MITYTVAIVQETWQAQDATLKRLTIEYELLGNWRRALRHAWSVQDARGFMTWPARLCPRSTYHNP